MKLSFAVGIILLAPALAFAQQNCDKPRNDFDGLYCLNKVYAQTDAELNEAYKELNTTLPDVDKNTLKSRQIDWIKKRNASCSKKIDDAFYVNLSCATKTTKERLEVLQERLRECKSSGCLPSKL